MDTNAIAKTLLVIYANQSGRWRYALEDLPEEMFDHQPGGDCKSIRQIGGHLVQLYAFQMKLLGESTEGMPKGAPLNTVAELTADLDAAEKRLMEAVKRHDEADWFALPKEERQGPWGDQPTLERLAHPLNDFVNHVGAIRAIRRILGCPAEKVQ